MALAEFMGEIDGIIAGVDRIGPQSLVRGRSRLKVIARNDVGVDGIDLVTATRLGLVVTNALETNTEAVADLVFGLMIARPASPGDGSNSTRGPVGQDAGA